jgi:NADH dehydrogenase [ubiquinone] 1 alpha subcomplex assembly factor 6
MATLRARHLRSAPRRCWLHARAFAAAAAGPAVDPDRYCADLVRRADYNGYMCSVLVSPKSSKPAVHALRAFNIEVASVRDAVRGNLAPGTMRLRWWKEVVATVYSTEPATTPQLPQEPVCLALAAAVKQHGLTQRWLDRMIDARHSEMEAPGWSSIADLETYAVSTINLQYTSLELSVCAAYDDICCNLKCAYHQM